jgi:branched-chain amino acid transport system substrate-binding protein
VAQLDRRGALKVFGALGASAIAAPLLSACAAATDSNGNPVSGPPVAIGLIAPSIGAFKTIGDEIANGFQLFLTSNAQQLGRRTARITAIEEGDDRRTLLANVSKLIDTGSPLALVGVASDEAMIDIVDLAERNQVPLIGACASPTTLQNVRYVWRTSYVNDEPGIVMGRHMARAGVGKVYVIGAGEPIAADEDINAFRQAFTENGGVLIGEPNIIPFPSPLLAADSSVTKSLMSSIRDSGADAIYAYFTGPTAAAFIKAYRRAGIKLPVYAPGFLTEGAVLGDVGDLALDITTVMNYSPDLNNQENNLFVVDYNQQYGRLPSTYAMAAFDAAAVLSKAILSAGRNVDPRMLNAEIGRLGSIESPRGSWQFNAGRTPTQTWFLRQVGLDGLVPANITQQRLDVLR